MVGKLVSTCSIGFVMLLITTMPALAQTSAYPAMAPFEQYLMPEAAEIELAKSAAPKSVSDQAEVMVLRKDGYATVAKGSNGFLCLVERGWATETTASEFWNTKLRSPNCFNQAAADSFAQIYLMKTRLVIQGKSKKEILQAISTAMDSKILPPVIPGAMCYMMSKQQYLNDKDKSWHPHLMFFVAGNVGKSWGADLPGSPIMSANDAEERVTIFMMVAGHWSDGTPAMAMDH
jgi:cytochrome c-type biogenesis protein CcmH/NrfF